MEFDEKKIREKMINFRAKNDYSIQEASEKVGISMATWQYIEAGRKKAKPVTLCRIEMVIDELSK